MTQAIICEYEYLIFLAKSKFISKLWLDSIVDILLQGEITSGNRNWLLSLMKFAAGNLRKHSVMILFLQIY